MKKPKVALVHDYLIQYGGAEKTLEAIAELFPQAPIYTSFYKPENFGDSYNTKSVITPKIADSVFSSSPILAKYFTFLIPLIFESFDLGDYDLIISDSSSYAKGVLTKPDQLHISYIHTPPRFLYKYSVENTKRNAWYYRPAVTIIDHFLRIWDFNAAQRPNYLVANSKEIAQRIHKFYGREAEVIYPPVELSQEEPVEQKNLFKEPYYLAAGRLVAYKNFDVVVNAFKKLPQLQLYIIGTGNEESRLKAMAADNVKFLGRVSDEEKHQLMRNCLGLINAVKDEDFGIVPIEVLSHGRPVLAHRSAGHLETIDEGASGMYFDNLSPNELAESIKHFDNKIKSGAFKPMLIRDSTKIFSKKKFQDDFYNFVMNKWEKHQS
jgi:glycosyltransferase involved in cell wall biosynthesis